MASTQHRVPSPYKQWPRCRSAFKRTRPPEGGNWTTLGLDGSATGGSLGINCSADTWDPTGHLAAECFQTPFTAPALVDAQLCAPSSDLSLSCSTLLYNNALLDGCPGCASPLTETFGAACNTTGRTLLATGLTAGALVCDAPSGELPGGDWSQLCGLCGPLYFNVSSGLFAASCLGDILPAYVPVAPRMAAINTSLCAGPVAVGVTTSTNTLWLPTVRLTCQPGVAAQVVGGDWPSYCSPLTWNQGVLVADCGLPNNQVSVIDTKMCSSGSAVDLQSIASLGMIGLLLCQELAPSAPGGPWFRSCSPVRMEGSLMSAYCSFVTGGVVRYSTLDLALCSVPLGVRNVKGYLSCVPPQSANPLGIPLGPWGATCSPLYWDSASGVLSARCAVGGASNPPQLTRLDTSSCALGSGLLNVDGALQCVTSAR